MQESGREGHDMGAPPRSTIFIVSILWPHEVPALPPEARTLRGWPLIWKCTKGMLPSLVLIFLVLGTIFMGLATPAMGVVVGALVLAAMNRRLTWPLLWQGMETTMRITAFVGQGARRRGPLAKLLHTV
jgi:TRAP-type mannitol/chloroaromatic compound transport system permease large subunit